MGAGRPVGGRRALVEPPLRARPAAADRLGEHVALAPALEHALLELGEGGVRIDAGGGAQAAWARDCRSGPVAAEWLPSERADGRAGGVGAGRGLLEPAEQLVAGRGGRLAGRRDGARRRCPGRAAVSRGPAPRGPSASDRVNEPRRSRRAARVPDSTTARGSSARSARPRRPRRWPGVSDSVRSPAPRQTELECLSVQRIGVAGGGARRGMRTRLGAAPAAPCAQRRQPAGRVAPRRTRTRPSGGPSRSLAVDAAAPPRSCARSSAGRGSPRAAGRRVLVERRERLGQPRGHDGGRRRVRGRARPPRRRCGSLRAPGAAPGSARARSDGGPRRSARASGTRPALPAAQRAGAHAQHVRGCIRTDHLASYRGPSDRVQAAQRAVQKRAPVSSTECHDSLPMTTFMRLRLYHHRDGARVAYRETGTGPAIVLLHSLGLSHREWEPIVSRWRRASGSWCPTCRCTATPRIGPRHPYTLDWLADVMAGFCREVGGAGPMIAGHDLGAELALRAFTSGRLEPARLVLMPNRLHRRERVGAQGRRGGSPPRRQPCPGSTGSTRTWRGSCSGPRSASACPPSAIRPPAT